MESSQRLTRGHAARRRRALLTEQAAWLCGLLALIGWAGGTLAGVAGARQDLRRFTELRAGDSPSARQLPQPSSPDLSLWNPARIAAWRVALTQEAPDPLAIVRIAKIGLEIAVLPGTSEFVLNRALGHIEHTALPGSDGNSGIAGHRDGFFRGLKDIAPGDAVELETLDGREMYRVQRAWIVEPRDVWVLAPTPVRALTLVTCYPFYAIGAAPKRFIVRAVPADVPTPEERR